MCHCPLGSEAGAVLPGERRRAGWARKSQRGRNSGAGRAAARLQTAFGRQIHFKCGEDVVWDGGFVPHPLILPLLGGSFATPPESSRNEEESGSPRNEEESV